MTLSDVLELLGRVQVTWPRTKWEAPVQFVGTVWLDYLADLPTDAVRATLLDLPPTWAPSPGELREAVLARIEPDSAPDIDQAWAEVRAMVARTGTAPYHRPFGDHSMREWSHPAVADAVQAFGWSNLCQQSDNPSTDRAHFRDFYLAARQRHRPRRTPPGAAAVLDAVRAERALPEVTAAVALGPVATPGEDPPDNVVVRMAAFLDRSSDL